MKTAVCKQWLLVTLALMVAEAVAVAAPGVGGENQATLAIVGGRLIDGFGGPPLEDAVILIEDDTIVAVGRVGQLAVPDSARVVDSNGMTVLPGLWDAHGHLWHVGEGKPGEFRDKFRDRMMEIMDAVAQTNLMAGITSFRDLGGPLGEQQALRADIESGKRIGPRLYLAGPLVRQRDKNPGVSPDEYTVGTPDEARAIAKRLIAMKVDQIDVEGLWDQPVLEAITATAHEAGIGVDAGVRHIQAYRTAIQAGVDRLQQVFTADPLSDYSDEDIRLLVRGARPIGSGPSANILRGPYIVPAIEMRNAYVRALRFPEIVDHPKFKKQFAPDIYDYLRVTWRSPQAIPWGIGAAERVKVAKRKLRRFIEAGGREQIVAGCDSGSPLNFHSPIPKEIANLAEAGLSPMEAIQSATLRPAQMQGVDDRLGTVSVGKLADIIVVDGDPLQKIEVLQHRVVHVIKDGIVYK